MDSSYSAFCATELNDMEESAADHLSDPVLEQLRSVVEADPEYQALMSAVMEGFPLQPIPPLTCDTVPVLSPDHIRYLGSFLDKRLTWSPTYATIKN